MHAHRSASVAKVTTPVPVAQIEAPRLTPLEMLVVIVSERTGYPPEMLDPDLDLEADLGVDSIKRIEILGLLGERLGGDLGGVSRTELVEELSQVKTLRGIAGWIDAKSGKDGAAAISGTNERVADLVTDLGEESDSSSAVDASDVSDVSDCASDSVLDSDSVVAEVPVAPSVRRFVMRRADLPPAVPNGFHLERRRFLITDDGRGVAVQLAVLLGQRGAHVEVVASRPETQGPFDGVIHLQPLAPAGLEDQRAALFELARAAVHGGAQWLIVVTGQSGRPGNVPRHGGLTALVKSVAREWPMLRCRAIDIDPTRPAGELAGVVFGELMAHDPVVHVLHDEAGRFTLRPFEAETPAQVGEPVAPLGRGDVALITGGGRGITAQVAVALATRFGCGIELVGRSALPGDESPALAACADALSLRRHLAAAGGKGPAQIEREVQRILADRQIRVTLAALARTGVPHRYHAADVRDAAAFGAVIADIYARHGRLDAVIHGAGVIEDKLLKDKTRASFERVFETKVTAATVLAEKLRPDCRHVVFFSSVAGVFGNRGQADYAAANEALDHLAHHLTSAGRRVLSVAWGPWGGTGMISPELEREYARRGVGLIPPAEGVDRLLDELARGQDAQVVLMAATPESLEGA